MWRCGQAGKAAIARVNLDSAPSEELLDGIKSACPDILDMHVVELNPHK